LSHVSHSCVCVMFLIHTCVPCVLFICVVEPHVSYYNAHMCLITGGRRLIGSPKLQINFHKRAPKYRALLRKMTYKDKGSYESSPPCTMHHMCLIPICVSCVSFIRVARPHVSYPYVCVMCFSHVWRIYTCALYTCVFFMCVCRDHLCLTQIQVSYSYVCVIHMCRIHRCVAAPHVSYSYVCVMCLINMCLIHMCVLFTCVLLLRVSFICVYYSYTCVVFICV